MATIIYKNLTKSASASLRLIKHPLLPRISATPPRQRSIPINSRAFTSTTPTADMSAQPFLDTMVHRRTYYQLKNSSPVSDARIQEIIKHTLLHVPSSFNSQTSRIVLLLKSEHEKLWDIVKETLKAVVPSEQFAATEKKLAGFRAGYGTILFFTDRPTVQGMQQKFALYADKFPLWATQSDGMHQYAIWTALEAEGLGCNLQHYNPLIDQKVAQTWNISGDWELSAQMVIGTPTGQPGEKTFKQVEGERLFVHGA